MPVSTQIKKLYNNPSVKSVGIYTFTNFFSKAVSFLLLFVFTNPVYISPSENGLLSLFSTSLLLLMPFLSMGIIHSVSADFYKLEKEAFRNYFSTSFVIPVLVLLISTAVLFFFRQELYVQYGFPAFFVWLIPLVTFLIFCNEQLLSLSRNNNEPMVYLKANIGKTLLELGLSFVLVVYFSYRWQGRVAGILVAYTVLFFYALYYFKKNNFLFGKIKKQYIYDELIYAIPIISLQAAIFSMSASDKFFLSHFTNDSNETVGIYSIAAVFASVINILSMALLQYFFPKIYSLLSKNEAGNSVAIRKYFLYYLGIMFAGLLFTILFTPLLYHFFIDEKYHSALEYNYLLCIGSFLWGISYFFYSFLLYNKEKRKILILSISCIAVSLGCNYFFIRSGKAYDAALAVCISYAVVFLLSLAFTSSYWTKLYAKHSSKLS